MRYFDNSTTVHVKLLSGLIILRICLPGTNAVVFHIWYEVTLEVHISVSSICSASYTMACTV